MSTMTELELENTKPIVPQQYRNNMTCHLLDLLSSVEAQNTLAFDRSFTKTPYKACECGNCHSREDVGVGTLDPTQFLYDRTCYVAAGLMSTYDRFE